MQFYLHHYPNGIARILGVLLVVACCLYAARWHNVRPKLPDTALARLDLDQRTACSGIYMFGDTGSGKTTLLKEIVPELLTVDVGACFYSVKADAAEDALDILKRINRPYKLFHVTSAKYNPLAFGLEQWSPTEVASQLTMASEVLTANGSGKAEAFWEGVFQNAMVHSITLISLAFEKPTLIQLYDFLTSVPKKADEYKTDEWKQKAFAYQVIMAAGRNASETQRSDLAAALNFFCDYIPAAGPKVSGAAITQTANLLAPLTRGGIRQVVEGESNILPSDPSNGHVVVWDYPVLVHYQPAQLLQTLFKIQMSRYILSTPPKRYTLQVTDECHLLTHSRFDAEYQSVCRSAKAMTINASQHLSGLINSQPEGLRAEHSINAWIGNHATKVFTATSDTKTQDYIIDLCGERRILMTGGGKTQQIDPNSFDPLGVGGALSMHFQQQFRQNIERGHITGLRRGENGIVDAVVYQNGRTPPFRFTSIERTS